MTKIQAFPFRRPAPEHISADDWQITGGSDIPEFLPHWEPASSISVHRSLKIKPAGIKTDCLLDRTAVIRVAAVWHSPGTSLRGAGDRVDLAVSDPTAEITLKLNMKMDGVLLAGQVKLETHIILLDPGKEQLILSPSRPGSLLWHDEDVIILEGNAARFPVELVDFKELGWLPEKAAWYLDWNSEDLHQMALGGLRLFVNTRHEQVKLAITSTTPDPSAQLISSAIRFDIGRMMIVGALQNDDFVKNSDSYDKEEGSIGLAIKRLLQTVFPNEAFSALCHRCTNEPFKFECELQGKLGLFWVNS
jgi:hypothetical protein